MQRKNVFHSHHKTHLFDLNFYQFKYIIQYLLIYVYMYNIYIYIFIYSIT